MLRVRTTCLLALLPLVLVAPARASGNGSTCTVSADGTLTCVATNPGHHGSTGSGGNGIGGCSYRGHSVPCTLDGAWFISSYSCYAAPIPPTGDERAPAGSSLWACIYTPNGAPFTNGQVIFPLSNSRAPLPDPATLAKKALGQIQLATARVSTAPSPPHPEVVGVEVWLWVPSAQWEALSKTVRAGATVVTATAVPNLVTWNPGDGSRPLQCGDAGRVWESSYTDAAPTDCGYTYRTLSAGQPGGVFRITATISYFVTWTCTGACTSSNGTLGLVAAPAGDGSIQSVQRQTVVVTP